MEVNTFLSHRRSPAAPPAPGAAAVGTVASDGQAAGSTRAGSEAVAGGVAGPPPSGPGPGGHRRGPADGGAGRHHRERLTHPHPGCARVLRYRPGMGRERVRPDLRRVPAARRPGRRHPRPAPRLHRRHHLVRGGLAGRRVRHQPGLAADLPGHPGRRRRDRRPDRAVAGHHHLPRGPGAEPGDGRVRGDEHRRRRGRPAGRRDPYHLPVLAVGVLRERPHRRRRRADGAAGAGRIPPPPRPVRPAGRGHRHRRPGRARLRPVVRRGHRDRRRALE